MIDNTCALGDNADLEPHLPRGHMIGELLSPLREDSSSSHLCRSLIAMHSAEPTRLSRDAHGRGENQALMGFLLFYLFTVMVSLFHIRPN